MWSSAVQVIVELMLSIHQLTQVGKRLMVTLLCSKHGVGHDPVLHQVIVEVQQDKSDMRSDPMKVFY